MAREVLTLAGQVIGAEFGPVGSAIGGAIGGAIGSAIDPPSGPDLGDRHVQISTYGANISRLYGVCRTAGIVFWAADMEEVAASGKGGPSDAPTSTFLGTFACALSCTRLRGIRKAWANGVLVYDDTVAIDRPGVIPIEFAFYRGTEDQLPDPTIESYEGVGDVPAYRGIGYLVISQMDLGPFGNRIPSMEFEVIAEQAWTAASPESLDSAAVPSGVNWRFIFHRSDGMLLLVGGADGESFQIQAVDPITGEYVYNVTTDGVDISNVTDIIYVAEMQSIFVAYDSGEVSLERSFVTRYDAITGLGGSMLDTFSGGVLPLGNPGAYLCFDPVLKGLNVYCLSQLGGYNLQRIDLINLRVGKNMPGLDSYGIGLTGGGRHIMISTSLDGFTPVDLAPARGNEGWEPMDNGWEVYLSVGAWNSYGKTATDSFPRCAFDPTRGRYVIVDDAGDLWTVTDAIPPVTTAQGSVGGTISGPATLIYLAGLDALVYATATGKIGAIDAATFAVLLDDYSLPDAPGGSISLRQSLFDPGAVYVVGQPFLDSPWRLYEQPLYATTVGKAVQDLCIASGYSAGNVDVTELTQRLRGFRVVQPGAVRAAIEQLGSVFLFDAAEEDDKIKFKRRGRASSQTFAITECVVQQPADRPIKSRRAQEADLPRRITLTAPDPASDYQPVTQRAERQAPRAGGDEEFSADIVLMATPNKRAVDAVMTARWAERDTAQVTLTAAGLRLAPADVVTLATRRYRIASKRIDNLNVSLDLVGDDADLLNQAGIGIRPGFARQAVATPAQTDAIFLDNPLLREVDDEPGRYWAAWGPRGWNGAVLYGSFDEGVTLEYLSSASRPGATVGHTTHSVPYATGNNTIDEFVRINVRMANGSFAGITRAQLLAGGNAAVLNKTELFHFQRAALEADGTYTLSGLLRARKSTEVLTGSHARGSSVVLVNTQIRTFSTDWRDEGRDVLYVPLTVGARADSAADLRRAIGTTVRSPRLTPRAPVDVRFSKEVATGDVAITWKRRTRYGHNFTGAAGIFTPLDEAEEKYNLSIHTSPFNAAAVRSETITTPSYTYTTADQTTDFGSPPANFIVRVAQVSARAGAGANVQATF